MDKVFVVVSHFKYSSSLFGEFRVCFATCSKSSASKVVSVYENNYPGTVFEIVETDLYE